MNIYYCASILAHEILAIPGLCNGSVENCSLCGSDEFKDLSYSVNAKIKINDDALCYCPNCGFEQKHKQGESCNLEICPDCKMFLKRK